MPADHAWYDVDRFGGSRGLMGELYPNEFVCEECGRVCGAPSVLVLGEPSREVTEDLDPVYYVERVCSECWDAYSDFYDLP